MPIYRDGVSKWIGKRYNWKEEHRSGLLSYRF